MNPVRMRRLRQISQLLSFGLFMLLFIQAVYLNDSVLPSDLFYRLDPLIAATAMLAGRTFIAGLLYAFINVIAALLLGRLWCGWLCPFGTLLEWVSPADRSEAVPEKWRVVKYLLLAAMLVAALLGNQTLAVLDPISILTRSMTVVIWPGLRLAVFCLEGFLYRFDALWPALDWLNQGLILPIFQGIDSVFIASLPVFTFLAAILALNWLARRFWCRYLCPLGGMLGLISRLALVHRSVSTDCIACGKCAAACPTATIDGERGFASDPAECTFCYDCAAVCPVDAISFKGNFNKWQPAQSQAYDPNRREMLLAMGGAVSGLLLAGIQPARRRQPERLIRPPGALMTRFEAMCMRCGECVRVCPTQGLQPSLLEGGWLNLLTPRLVPRLGYCSYNCDACLRVCPTGAIPALEKPEKQRTPIGLASINTDRCLPWAYDTLCSVCEEMCPLPEKAITLEEVQVTTVGGELQTIFRPQVLRERCIGCGVCEYHCPVGGEAAIQVYTLPTPGTGTVNL